MLFECGVTEAKIQNYSKYYCQQYENSDKLHKDLSLNQSRLVWKEKPTRCHFLYSLFLF